MGASRSVSLVIHYIMNKKKMSYNQALDYIKEKRKIANPTVKLSVEVANKEAKLDDSQIFHEEIDDEERDNEENKENKEN